MMSEENKRRRQAKKRRARSKRRMVFVGLGAAIALVAVCVALVFVLGNDSSDAEVAPSYTKIHFVAGGDLNITDNVVASGGSNNDYTNVFMDVAHLLADADLAALNFEGNLYGAPYGEQSAPASMAQALDRAGVDILQIANSRTINRGLLGLNSTINTIRQNGMEPIGAYENQQEAKKNNGYVIYNVKGVRIGVVAFTKGVGGETIPANGAGCINLLYKDYDDGYQQVDTEGISKVLGALNEEKPDITIALLHWGTENTDIISASQKKIVSLMQQNGVDAIIGTHPHRVQKMEYDEEKGTFVAYSLGDFYSDVYYKNAKGEIVFRAGTEYSVLLDLEITKNDVTGETKITGYDYTPIFTVTENYMPQRVVRIHEAMAAFEAGHIDAVSKEVYDQMAYALTRIKARVAGE